MIHSASDRTTPRFLMIRDICGINPSRPSKWRREEEDKGMDKGSAICDLLGSVKATSQNTHKID